jgi:hypothetical protein
MPQYLLGRYRLLFTVVGFFSGGIKAIGEEKDF